MNKYDSYKDSQINGLGQIPSHWQAILFKRVIDKIKDGTHGSFKRVSVGYNFLSAKNVHNDEIKIGDNESQISEDDYREITKNGFPALDDLLITCVGTIGRTCVYPFQESIAFQRSVSFLRLSKSIANPFYYKYYVESDFYQNYLKSIAKTSAQSGVYLSNILESLSLLPPIDEQTSIANYLEQKTTDIDKLISKKVKLIKLMEEEKTAVINQAVTKGLDPNVPMKDSGVEWLGKIPEHWFVWKMSHLYPDLGSGTTPRSDNQTFYLDGNINWLNTGDLNNSYIKSTSKKITKKALKAYPTLKEYPENSVVMAMYGATIGKVGMLEIASTVNQACCVFPKSEIAQNEFLFYWLISHKEEIVNLSKGGGQPNISQDIIKRIKLTIPNNKEQLEIIQEIKKEEIRLEKLKENVQKEINLLKEYKSSLISEVVTGKVDVRDEIFVN